MTVSAQDSSYIVIEVPLTITMIFIEGVTRFNWWVWLVPVRHLEKLEAMQYSTVFTTSSLAEGGFHARL